VELRSDGPIRSLLADDESLEQLDAFVVSLGEQIDALQDAEQVGALDEAAKRAFDLASDAARLGLPPLAHAAKRTAESCRRGDSRGAHAEIVALTDVVRRVRLGHRSGAL